MDRTRSLQKVLLWWAYRECHNLRMVPSHYIFILLISFKVFSYIYMHWVCMHWSEEVWVKFWVYPCPSGPLAVVGLACRLPNAYSVEHFWESLKAWTNFAGKKQLKLYSLVRQDTLWPVNCQYCLDRFHEKAWDGVESLSLGGWGFGSFDCRCCSRPWLRLPFLEVLGTSCCQLMEHSTWHNAMKSHAQNVVPRCTNGY